jgi:CheY-like chemotaxis protein
MADRTILVIDDDEDSAEFVKAVLEAGETRVLSARDGEAGLALARKARPDLIVLDVQMPKMDGFTVLTELRQDAATKAIPVVMLTGVGEKTGVRFSKADVGDFIGLEPDAYVEKPVDPETLRSTLEDVLRK